MNQTSFLGLENSQRENFFLKDNEHNTYFKEQHSKLNKQIRSFKIINNLENIKESILKINKISNQIKKNG
ncbi:MAG: hypothetical protein K0S74_1839 [Chlamydiales bacterium]|jgi:hypothetical protein|nr:hypothetical protein [Chlamydiales bacterium]